MSLDNNEDDGTIVGQDISNILEDMGNGYDNIIEDEIESSIEVDRYNGEKVQIRTAMDLMRHFAASMNTELKDPNPGCRKCSGRGYTAIDSKTKYPIPCTCIFLNEDKTRQDNITMKSMLGSSNLNRSQKRQQDKFNRKHRITISSPPKEDEVLA